MRRVTAALVGVLIGVCAQVVSLGVAAADPACEQYDSHGICVVEAESDPSGGQPTTPPDATGTGSSDGSQEASCTLDATGEVIPCQEGSSWWVQSMQCYAQELPEQPPKDSPIWGGHTDGAIYLCTYFLLEGEGISRYERILVLVGDPARWPGSR